MAHEHPVYDTDKRFVIDPETRVVAIPKDRRPVLIQYDHNSEHITFEIDQFVEGHDLAKSHKVEVHYNNLPTAGKGDSRGVYEVTDLQTIKTADGKSKIIFTWVVSQNAVAYAGPLAFVVSFTCFEDTYIGYRWSTAVNNDLRVSDGINNGEAVERAYADVLAAWKEDLFGVGDTEEARLLEASGIIKESIEAKGRETLNTIPDSYVELQATIDGLLDEIDDRTLLNETYIEDITSTFELKHAYLHGNGGALVNHESGVVTSEAISCSVNDVYYITATAVHQTSCIVTYDKDRLFLRSYGYNPGNDDGAILVDYRFVPAADEAFVRFASFDIDYGTDYELIIKKERPMSASKKVETEVKVIETFTAQLDSIRKMNVLYGKKYVACGDSFTQGAFSGFVDENGLSSTNSPVIYDKTLKMYKTYPWWIGTRNGMTVINEAIGGSDFTNVEGAANPFSLSRYLAVPTDADYITLMFGLNETGLTAEQIGTRYDVTNRTLWGAYNVVFGHFLANMPYAKIGVIIPDAWITETYSNAVKEICAYWGIPCLDLKNDPTVPMGIYGRHSETSSKARELRDAAFTVTESNSHPNVKAHEYRSTIIENFIRSL